MQILWLYAKFSHLFFKGFLKFRKYSIGNVWWNWCIHLKYLKITFCDHNPQIVKMQKYLKRILPWIEYKRKFCVWGGIRKFLNFVLWLYHSMELHVQVKLICTQSTESANRFHIIISTMTLCGRRITKHLAISHYKSP